MESTNNFLDGIDGDRTQLITKPNSYIYGENLDIILNETNGSFVLTNSKGNKFQK